MFNFQSNLKGGNKSATDHKKRDFNNAIMALILCIFPVWYKSTRFVFLILRSMDSVKLSWISKWTFYGISEFMNSTNFWILLKFNMKFRQNFMKMCPKCRLRINKKYCIVTSFIIIGTLFLCFCAYFIISGIKKNIGFLGNAS